MITHDVLLSLGFEALRPNQYVYKSITGQLQPQTGTFHLQGFSQPITQISNLTFVLRLIDWDEAD